MSGPLARPRRPRGRGQRPAVMTDVAKLAGVSHQTVSRVLHDSPHVRRGTRERVLKAIRQLDYRPNPVAQALVTGRSRSLGVVSFDTTLYGPASTLLGIEGAAEAPQRGRRGARAGARGGAPAWPGGVGRGGGGRGAAGGRPAGGGGPGARAGRGGGAGGGGAASPGRGGGRRGEIGAGGWEN